MKQKRYVRFKETPKVLRKVRVSFTVSGKRVSFTKIQKVPKRINVGFISKARLRRRSLSTTDQKSLRSETS